jgi:hypothetical protein
MRGWGTPAEQAIDDIDVPDCFLLVKDMAAECFSNTKLFSDVHSKNESIHILRMYIQKE